ncbi:unnamed protein product [Nesidiocoris tenuis]|uniref:Uncharacterized protein n=1 Tax=Nesidiocoris tenuis TaxID=355587 RepID=A0A6H5FYY0_9HEMI|nr:unnamed protein product [Nesidiocoris tenuis]
MPLTKEELEVMSYKDVVKLAQENGVYNRKSSKKAALIKKLSALWTENEEASDARRFQIANQFRATLCLEVMPAHCFQIRLPVDPRGVPATMLGKIDGKPSPRKILQRWRNRILKVRRLLWMKTMRQVILVVCCYAVFRSQRFFVLGMKPSPSFSASGTEPSPNSKSTDPPLRQRTFTKDEDNVEIETPPSRKRTRQNTFKMTPDDGIVKYEIPPATAPPIEKLSVFERLSVKLSSSARRSLVASERKSVNQTPTSAKVRNCREMLTSKFVHIVFESG